MTLIVGGLLMVPMWVRFTTLHGPTSFNENRHWLGGSSIFWGGMMGFASLLIVIGVYGHRALLEAGGRSARIGFWLVLAGLGIPALADIALRAAVPPFLMPLAATGLILLAAAHRHDPALPMTCRVALLITGLLLSAAFLMNLVPLETLDRFQWYRLYGILSNVLFGLGWVVFGASLAWKQQAVRSQERSGLRAVPPVSLDDA
ncbi:hypothetical protein [Gaiella sp.]|uniref:hypothetical protein n=1 Tax=Gaiella sp. TaxID=2663207 RepID=UPI00398357BD